MTTANALKTETFSTNDYANALLLLLDNAHSLIAFKDLSGHFLQVNARFGEVFKSCPEEMIGKRISDFYAENEAHCYELIEKQAIKDKTNIEAEIDLVIQGQHYFFLSSHFPLLNQDGEPYAIGCILTDISYKKRTDRRLALSERILNHTNEGIVVTSPEGYITDINQAYSNITGYSREELIGNKPNLLQSGRHDDQFYQQMWQQINDTGHWEGEIWDRRKNGEIYPKWLSIITIFNDDNSINCYIGMFTDITEKKKTEQELEHLHYFDPLTKLPNRILLADRLKQALSLAKRENEELAVLIMDLGRFKFINDSLGHHAGDELLEIVAKELNEIVRDSDTVARLGDDEFAILLPELRLPEDASIVAQNIINKLAVTYELAGQHIEIHINIGIASFPDDSDDAESLINSAELALYKAKELGANNYLFFSQDLQDAIANQLALENALKEAIEQDQLTLYYQPKIDLKNNQIIGMEALVRWIHPEKGMIPPDQFIPFAEESNLILSMGEWIIRTACRETAQWHANTKLPLVVAINLSAKQFREHNLLDKIRAVVEEHALNPECIELEITESSVMDNVEEALETMHRLRNHGLKLAIDDFGTGYSSLSYLKRFPINTLKIDQSFVRELTEESDDAAIVEAIISMADKLRLNVVAEGVETEDQLQFLTDKGCQNGQGYFLSRPLPSHEFESFLQRYIPA